MLYVNQSEDNKTVWLDLNEDGNEHNSWFQATYLDYHPLQKQDFSSDWKNKIELQLHIEKYKIIDSPSNEETYLVILTQ